jgi:hypothetical protein
MSMASQITMRKRRIYNAQAQIIAKTQKMMNRKNNKGSIARVPLIYQMLGWPGAWPSLRMCVCVCWICFFGRNAAPLCKCACYTQATPLAYDSSFSFPVQVPPPLIYLSIIESALTCLLPCLDWHHQLEGLASIVWFSLSHSHFICLPFCIPLWWDWPLNRWCYSLTPTTTTTTTKQHARSRLWCYLIKSLAQAKMTQL